jgi:hypothetical protein
MRKLLREVVDFEHSFLSAREAVWDVQLVKIMCVALGVAAAGAFPALTRIGLHWYLLVAATAALKPAARAVLLFWRRVTAVPQAPLNPPLPAAG